MTTTQNNEFKTKIETLASLVHGKLESFDHQSFNIVFHNGAKVWAWYDRYNAKNKIEFRLDWPKDIDQRYKNVESWSWSFTGETREAFKVFDGLSINCSMTKTVEALFNDLHKRLKLDEYKRLYALCLDYNRTKRQGINDAKAQVDDVFKVLESEGYEPRYSDNGLHKARIYSTNRALDLDVSMYDNNPTYTIDLTLDQAQMISFISWVKDNNIVGG